MRVSDTLVLPRVSMMLALRCIRMPLEGPPALCSEAREAVTARPLGDGGGWRADNGGGWRADKLARLLTIFSW